MSQNNQFRSPKGFLILVICVAIGAVVGNSVAPGNTVAMAIGIGVGSGVACMLAPRE